MGCSPVYIERLDNPNQEERPVFTRMMEDIQEKDIIYIRQFSYLANSIDMLIQRIEEIEQKQIGLFFIKNDIQSNQHPDIRISEILKMGKEVMFNMKKEATHVGLSKARKQGRIGGRPTLPNNNPIAMAAENLYLNTELPIREIVQILNITPPTLYRYLRQRGIKFGK